MIPRRHVHIFLSYFIRRYIVDDSHDGGKLYFRSFLIVCKLLCPFIWSPPIRIGRLFLLLLDTIIFRIPHCNAVVTVINDVTNRIVIIKYSKRYYLILFTAVKFAFRLKFRYSPIRIAVEKK